MLFRSLEYKCSNHKLIRESAVEEYLLNNISNLAKDYINKNTIISCSNKKNDNSKKIKDTERKVEKLKDLYLDDLIDKNTYKKDYEKLNKQLNELRKVDTIPVQKDFSRLQNLINSNFIEIYNNLTLEEKRTFFLSIVDKIYIENNEIKEITFL